MSVTRYCPSCRKNVKIKSGTKCPTHNISTSSQQYGVDVINLLGMSGGYGDSTSYSADTGSCDSGSY